MFYFLTRMVVTQVCTFVNCHPKGIVICEFYFLCKLYCKKKKKVVKKKRLWLYIILQIFYSHMNFIFSASLQPKYNYQDLQMRLHQFWISKWQNQDLILGLPGFKISFHSCAQKSLLLNYYWLPKIDTNVFLFLQNTKI